MPDSRLDLICCTVVDGALATLGSVPTRGAKATLPWGTVPSAAESLDSAATRLARAVLGRAPAWMAQIGAFTDLASHPSGATLSIAYAVVVPTGTEAPTGHGWHRVAPTKAFAEHQQRLVRAAVTVLRNRMDIDPITFRLLPPQFTLTELQGLYELLLGRRLHKASFRRALQAAHLIEPLDEWRSEGPGRPAQLFRYSPQRQRRTRSLRFELLD